jgi:hypothetical protein
MLIRRRRRGLRFPAAMDLDQPLKFMCALAALFYPTFSHCIGGITMNSYVGTISPDTDTGH